MCSKVKRVFFIFEMFKHLFCKVRGYPNRVSSPVAVHATNSVQPREMPVYTPVEIREIHDQEMGFLQGAS